MGLSRSLSPLRKRQIVDEDCNGKTNIVQTIFNMVNANLGTGILTMPYVIRLGGYWGIGLTLLIGALSNYTGKILIRMLYEEDDKERRILRHSYADIGEEFNTKYGRYLVHVINCVEQSTHCILLLIMPGTLIAHTFPRSGLSENVWIALSSLVIIPTIFVRKMYQVTWTSIFSVAIGFFISISVLIYSSIHQLDHYHGLVADFEIDISPICIGIIVVTYSSHAYLPAIERCMLEPELYESLFDFSMIVVTIFKIIVGILVYLVFTSNTYQIMTMNLPRNIIGDAFNIAAVALSLSFYPVPMFAVFDILENQITSLPCLLWIVNDEDYYLNQQYLTRNLAFRFGVVITFVMIATCAPHFSLLMSLIGSTTGMTLAFIYPCLFHIKINWHVISNNVMLINALIIIFAVIGGALGFSCTVRQFYSVLNERT